MNKTPYFSIITPTLNSEKTIEATVRSVISQRFSSLEYIIIDGLSTDTTIYKIQEIEKKLIIVQEKDLGIFDAMNKGISSSHGQVIGIINSDDWYLPGTFERVREEFDSTGADVVVGGVDIFKEQIFVSSRIHHPNELNFHMLSHPAVFVRSSVYKDIGTFNLEYKIAADYDFLLRAYNSGHRFSSIDQSLAGYSLDGFSDSPRNRIRSILETESIRFRNSIVSKNRAKANFLEFSAKTILKRNNRFSMVLELFKSLGDIDIYFSERVNCESQ